MAERDPIEVLKEQVNKVDGLTGLHADHEAFVHWQGETKTVLEKIFNTQSIYYQSFLALRFREMSVKAFTSPEIDKIDAARYKRDLEHAKNILQGAIKELTLDRTLFKKMQTTPKVVEVSLEGEYYISSESLEPDLIQAIESAFKGSGLKVLYGAEGDPQESSFDHRVHQIKRARFGIYDLSAPGKTGILLDLGAALGLGKEAIIIYKKGSSFPAVVKPFMRIEYEDLSELSEKLKKRIKL
jgi:hypothetical protein